MKKQLPGWAVLLIITLVAGLALGVTYSLTKDPIAEQTRIQAENARKTVMPDAESFEELSLEEGASMDWAYTGLKTEAGKTLPLTLDEIDAIAGATFTSQAVVDAINQAYAKYQAAEDPSIVFTGEAEGFISPVAVAATFDGDHITQLTIGDQRFAETEGLGSKVRSEEFIGQFLGGEKVVGYVAQTTVQGFKGEAEVIAGVGTDLRLTGISVGGSNFSETAGLGAKAKDPGFTDQFSGKQAPVRVIKAGGTPAENTVDAITAATITSNAVAGGVNSIANFVKTDLLGIAEAEMPARPDDAQVFGASVQGFHGPVYVEAAFDGSSAITYFAVGDENFSETPEFGGHARDVDFMYQFIGKTAPLTLSDIDALSGATITSKAVVSALNMAYDLSQGAEIVVPETPTLPEKPADAEVYSASVQGFAGPVAVEAAFDGDGKVTYIAVGDDRFAETDGLGARALQPEFQIQFIGKQMPLKPEDIDALAGATITSNAVVAALNEAYDASRGIVKEAVAPTEEAEKPEVTFVGDAEGFASTVAVEAAFDGDTITWLAIGDKRFEETPGFGAKALDPEFAAQFIGKTAPLAAEDIDAIAGATFTTNAVVEAVNKAYKKSLAAAEAPAEPVIEKPENTVTASAQGFAGPVAVEAAFDEEGKITYLTIGDTAFAETPGLGAKALEDSFQAQFIGKQMPLKPEDIDALAGATITSNAVVAALNDAYDASQGIVKEAPVPAEEPAKPDVTFTGDAEGFASTVAVEAAFDGDTITWLAIGDKRFEETAGFGAKALEPAFAAQFIGKTAPLAAEDIDAIAGATFTTNAVVEAVNKAYKKSLAAAEAPAEPVIEKPENTVTASAQGFAGPVAVEAAFDEEGKITYLTIGDAAFAETPGLGAKALEDSFQAQFIGKQMPLKPEDIDALAGATITSNAVVAALNDAYAQIAPAAEKPAPVAETEEPVAEPTPEPSTESEPDRAAVETRPETDAAVANGYFGDSLAFSTSVRVQANFAQGKLTALAVCDKPAGGDEYTPSPLEDALKKKFLGAEMPLNANRETAYEAAVAIALNQAYDQYTAAADQPDPLGAATGAKEEALPTYTGECILFFDRIVAEAAFDGGRLAQVSVTTYPIGRDSEAVPYAWVFWDDLIGEQMPLDPAHPLRDVDEATARAVIIAINDAYQHSLAGQQ